MKKILLLTLLLFALPALAAGEPAPMAVAQAASAMDAADADAAPAAAPRRRAAAGGFRPSLKTGVDDVLLELGGFGDAPEADASATLRASPYVLWQPQREWEFRAGVLIDGLRQQGGAQPLTDWRADVTDTYARWRSGDTRFTAGAQTVVWGRVDDISTIDRVSRVDLTRFVLDDLAERRRTQLALRWEQTLGDYKADAVLLPAFRGARLPDDRSVWSLVNRQTGEIIGIAPSEPLAALAKVAPIRQDDGGAGGAALRLTRTAVLPFDFGLTLARARQSLPYFRVDAVEPSITAIHPYTTFAGADVEFATGELTWRSEIGFTHDQPVTLPGGQRLDTDALEWVGAVEFFPGGDNTRVSLQIAARGLRTKQAILELDEYYSINGEVETTFDQGRWRFSVRFNGGLNVHDVYVAPNLSYLGWEPHELYVAAHHFDGESRTYGGFHRDHGMLAIGLKTKF
ncbi:MAG: hypothetical protein MUF16_20540 [Burkholderiaceae bacterium]|jgi:hypothetical protein|nr:hypothetical protein [Burkholderiaceae bacterium]